MTVTALAAYEQAVAKGQKTYNRKKISDNCDRRNHSQCAGEFHGYASYVIPTLFRCPCKCHAPQATCKRCGATGLAWAETWKFGRSAWSLYQPLTAIVNETYRMEHHCGVDHNDVQARKIDIDALVREEDAWTKTERFIAREDGNDARSTDLTTYRTLHHDLAHPGEMSFEVVLMDELATADADILERARALYDAGKGNS